MSKFRAYAFQNPAAVPGGARGGGANLPGGLRWFWAPVFAIRNLLVFAPATAAVVVTRRLMICGGGVACTSLAATCSLLTCHTGYIRTDTHTRTYIYIYACMHAHILA